MMVRGVQKRSWNCRKGSSQAMVAAPWCAVYVRGALGVAPSLLVETLAAAAREAALSLLLALLPVGSGAAGRLAMEPRRRCARMMRPTAAATTTPSTLAWYTLSMSCTRACGHACTHPSTACMQPCARNACMAG